MRIFFLYPFSRDTLRTRWASGVGWCCLSTHVLYLYRFFFFFFLHPSPSFTRRAPTSSRLLPSGCMEGVANSGYRVTSFVNGNRWEEKKRKQKQASRAPTRLPQLRQPTEQLWKATLRKEHMKERKEGTDTFLQSPRKKEMIRTFCRKEHRVELIITFCGSTTIGQDSYADPSNKD